MSNPSRPGWVDFIQRHGRWFMAADKVLKTLFEARGGGVLAVGLASMSAVGTAVATLYPADSGWVLLRNMNLRDMDLTVGGYLCDLLLAGRPYEVIAATDFGTLTILWRDDAGEPLAGAVYNAGRFSDGPFVRPGGLEKFYQVVRNVVWTKSQDLRLTVMRGENYAWRATGRFHLEAMTLLGPYLGSKQPEEYAARLARYPPGPRTIVLRGPTGVGKSVLARHVARIRGGPDTRVLKVSSEVLRQCRSDEILGIVQCFQPTVLLLDDLEVSKTSDFLLDLLESLRDPQTLTFVTVMTPFAEAETPAPGIWYAPGMRPGGRVDEFWSFGPPDAEVRGRILDHYARDLGLNIKDKTRLKIIEATNGLTGAYIGNVALRLATFGVKNWREEVDAVLWTAPFKIAEKKEGTPPSEPPKG